MGVKPNPKHLALWAIAGATLAASPFFATFLPKWLFQTLTSRCAILLTPLLIGGVISYLAQSRLRRGHLDDLWSESELVPVRSLLSNPLWQWTLVGAFLVILFTVAFSNHHGTLIYLMTIPMNTVNSMRQVLAPPIDQTRSGLRDWRNFKPLHSDHWGEPAQRDNSPLPS